MFPAPEGWNARIWAPGISLLSGARCLDCCVRASRAPAATRGTWPPAMEWHVSYPKQELIEAGVLSEYEHFYCEGGRRLACYELTAVL